MRARSSRHERQRSLFGRDNRRNPIGRLKVDGVTNGGNDLNNPIRDRRSHGAGDIGELRVTFAADENDGHSKLREPIPHRRKRACPKASKRPRKPIGRAAPTIGLSHGLGGLGHPGEDRRPRPPLGEIVDLGSLNLLRESLIGLQSRCALNRIR